jgi:SNF2 family DNA or RNA helicase
MMIVLHGGVFKEEFFLWGETPGDLDAQTALRPGRQKKSWAALSVPQPLRYDAGTEKLSIALKETGLGFKINKKSFEPLIVWLPTFKNAPVPSSPMIAEASQPVTNAPLAPWKVTVLRLPVDKAVEFLCQCADRQTLGLGIVAGKDLTFFAMAMRFAAGLVTRGQFLPDMIEKDGAYLARWKPVFSGADRERFVRLGKSMPAVSLALSCEVATSPATSPQSLLTEFLGRVVDHLVRRGRPSGQSVVHDSIHDQWLHALASVNGVMEAGAAQLQQLATQVGEWGRPVRVSTIAPFRLCFRIEEPDGEDSKSSSEPQREEWSIRYLLQANHDPSLLIPAEEVWKEKKIRSFGDGKINLREYLLLSLGQASGVCPFIEASLRRPKPAGYRLDAAGVHEFLTQRALTLEQLGFGVMLPAWWTPKGAKLRLTARASVKTPQMQSAKGFTLHEIVQFDWEMALGGERLSFDELQQLAKLKAPLVKVRGRWVQINPEEIPAVLEFLKRKAAEKTTVREVVRMALGGGRGPGGIPVEGISARGWIAELLGELNGEIPFQELSPPEGFQGVLRPYQVRGYSWLGFLKKWGLGACLADDMGLGKTIQTLTLIQRDWQLGERRPLLLICPTSVVSNWEKEAGRFTPDLPVMVHHGIERARGQKFKKDACRHAIVVSSYALLQRDMEVLKEVNWAGIVLDEAQNIKNPETKQAKAARAIQGDYRIALTGTPVENSVGDLWSIMEFLNPGFLGTWTEFKERFFIPIQAARDPEATERLKHLTGPFILRRLKADKTIIADLPEKMEMKVFCALTKEQASLYEAVVKETLKGLDETGGIQRKGIVLATLSKLKQVCNHPAQFLGDNSQVPGRSGKLARLTEMVEEMMEVGDRALIFSQFVEMGAILQRYLQEAFGREALFLHGGVLKKHRDRMVERFQADGNGPSLFILSLKAGGTGLNLTRANHVIHFDRWWNPAVENQATDRVFRIGQTRNVQVHKFICSGTLEEKIDEMIERKKEISENVIGTGEAWLTELSTAELKNLFALRKETIGDLS